MRRTWLACMCVVPLACFSDPGGEEETAGDDVGTEASTDSSESESSGSSTDESESESESDSDSETDGETTTDSESETTEGPCADPVCFAEPIEIGAGFGPVDVVIADVDGDGLDDIVTANAGGDNVAVLHGEGGGDFAAPTFYTVGPGEEPVSVAALDLDPDDVANGGVDLIVGNRLGQSIAVLINTGSMVAYDDATIIQIGTPVHDLSVGNFTLDTVAESVVGAIADQGVLVTHGTGTGLAGDLDAAPTTDPATAVTAGMLTQDPYSDFVAVSDSGSAVTVTLFLDQEPFLDAFDLQIGGNGSDVRFAALNPDPVLDLVVAVSETGSIVVFPGQGNGTFGSGQDVDAGANPAALAIGDVDDDGNSDVVFVTAGGGQAGILLGNGDTTFADPLIIEDVGARPAAVALADFNGDGQLDIVTANADGNNVSVLLTVEGG